MRHLEDVRQIDGQDSRATPTGPELPLKILQLEQDGCVRSCTSGAFGLSVGELIGARLHDLLTPAAARRLDHAIRAATEGGVFRLTVRARNQRSMHRLIVARSHRAADAPRIYSVMVSPTANRRLSAVSASRNATPPRRRILVAEDEPMLLQLSCRVLAQAGFEATPLVDGKAVLETLAKHDDVGLVILDLSLPGPSTSDLLRLVRDLEHPPRILLVTGRPIEEIEEVLVDERMPEHLQKPYSNERLIETVRRLLD